jgi:hypothetical protein
MTLGSYRRAKSPRRALAARRLIVCLAVLAGGASSLADEFPDPAVDSPLMLPQEEFLDESVGGPYEAFPADEAPVDLSSNASEYSEWGPPIADELTYDAPPEDLRPIDYMRHWGLRHSSSHGRFVNKSEPLLYSSWLNRPYYVDWFVGPVMTDSPADSVGITNDLLGGFRIGWDFDYYWGVEWRLGWASPNITVPGSSDEINGRYFIGDVDFVYYPWGDTRVRPYFQIGLGVTEFRSLHDDGTGIEATMLSMPFGVGVMFPQTHWLAWRLDIIDNLAFGGDGVDTMNNISFTAGMEMRFGARPKSYWPWRSSRTIW